MPNRLDRLKWTLLGDVALIVIPVLALVLAFDLRPGQAAADESQAPGAKPGKSDNWDRLRAMPREQRMALWGKLREFDALGAAERSAIRRLDEQIAELTPTEKANYWSVLRRYHHWLAGLTEQQQSELKAASPAERMRLVTKFRGQERTGADRDSTPMVLQIFDFSGVPPIETAHRLKAWFDLPAEKRVEIEALDSSAEQQDRLHKLAQFVKFPPIHRLTKTEEDELLKKLDEHVQLSDLPINPLKKQDPTKSEKARRRLAMNYYFLEHPPAAVDPDHLMRFASALPTCIREVFDHLPPEEARRRLTILYRLVFPAGTELPADFRPVRPGGR
jgi:hypothetical protein